MNATYGRCAVNERLVSIGKREIFISEFGRGPTVLMLHGGGPGASGVSNYSRNIEALAARYRVLVPDMPGYGKSTKGIDQSDPFGDLAQSMLGLLDALKIGRAHVVGISLGGACALRMAIERPEAVGRLVLMGPGGVNTTRAIPTAGLRRLLGYYKGDGPTRDKLATFVRGDLVYDARDVTDAIIDERFRASIDPEVVASPPLRGPRGMPKVRLIDFTRDDRLKAVQTPTLVLWGIEDKVNRASGAKTLAKIMSNCDVHLYSKTGHWVQWERADEFNAMVTTFLAQDASVGAVN
ncbi:alpha/beta fold hydrolase [Paraburkholderia sp. J67]|uniref:alpha/beta fold hydrolase n=1 Tax=Paraburkholderia sp. J67 TaxID=2805435 RepID=UPI002ABDF14D|nr:alpha/beta fold hydrolase [Paraburkholderia sp. J67]